MANRNERPAAGRAGIGNEVDARLNEALAHHQAGRVGEAERLYRQILAAQPGNAQALHFLGCAALQSGRPEEAAKLIGMAARRRRKDPQILNNLGEAYRVLSRLDEAAKYFRRAIALDAGDPAPHNNLGNVLLVKGDADGAVACFGRALAARPDDPEILSNLGGALLAQGNTEDAMRHFDRARRAAPDDPVILFNVANGLRKGGKLRESVACYRRALTAGLDDPEILNNLGNALTEQGEYDEAVACFRRVVAAHADAAAHNNLGGALEKQGSAEEAIAAFERAIAIDPDLAEAHRNLGKLRFRLGQLDEAEASVRRAIKINPSFAEAHRDLAHILLLAGNFKEGWPELQWRWKCRDFTSEERHFRQPPWSGENVEGKTLLVWGEQGVGDEVGFASMVPDLAKRGARVVLECDPRLVPLFARSFAGVEVIARTSPPAPRTAGDDIDYQVPSGNLGRWLRPTVESFPRRRAYLAADRARQAALVAKYRTPGTGGLRVGIAWRSKNVDIGGQKSMSLAELAPLAAVPGVTLVDLQYGDTEAERKAFKKETGAAVLHDAAVDQMADLDAFAAQVAALDLVISVSNTTVHMAGALAVPTWVMLPTVPMWRWMRDRADSPWYPSLRLFRQSRPGDWPALVARVARELAGLDAQPRSPTT